MDLGRSPWGPAALFLEPCPDAAVLDRHDRRLQAAAHPKKEAPCGLRILRSPLCVHRLQVCFPGLVGAARRILDAGTRQLRCGSAR